MKNAAVIVRDLAEKTERLLALVKQDELVAGSLYVSSTRCGRKACKCMSSDYRHESCCLSFIEDGKSRTRTVSEEMAPSIRAQTAAYSEVKILRREIVKQEKELLDAVDDAIAHAASRGQKKVAGISRPTKGEGQVTSTMNSSTPFF
jgi:autonomous glycyl radical cofactor GrcA